MLKVPKFNFSLLCITFLLAVRDIAVGLGMPVFIFLLFIFLIPVIDLVLDLLNRSLSRSSILTLVFLTLFYLAIAPFNDGNGFKYFLPMIYAGYAFRNVSYKQICMVFMWTQFIVLIMRMFLIHLGMIPEEMTYFAYKGEYGTSYHDLGYGNPNAAGMAFFFFIVSLHLFMYERHKKTAVCLIFAISFFSLEYTASRTSFLASMLLVIIYIIPTGIIDRILKNKFLLFCVPIIIIIPLLLSNWLMDSHEEVNEVLSNRVYIVSVLMELFNSPKTLLTGTVVEEGIPIDNVFCYMLINYGIVSIIVFFLRYMHLIKNRGNISINFLAPFLVIIISGFGEAAWAAFGGIGASLFWILLFNNTYMKSIVK